MEQINFYEKPVPHLIVDGFLEPRLAKICLDECIRLEPHYADAKVTQFELLLDDCAECVIEKKFIRDITRDNKVIYYDSYFKDKRRESLILRSLEHMVFSDTFMQLLQNLPYMFPIIANINSSETILSSYGKCDFYGWHPDTLPKAPSTRILTLIYYMNIEPPRFTGGNLVISGKNIADNKEIIPKHNRAVIFESKRVHRVTDVQTTEGFKYHRFSINMWFGFNGSYKFPRNNL